jgi:hypothetical protein
VQRLSDQRRTLALVGLAAAAVVGAKVARRKAARSAPDFAPPPPQDVPEAMSIAPEPEPPAPAEGGPIAAIEVLGEPAPAPAEPNTEELAAAEVAVLAILSQDGRREADRTALAVATTLEREAAEVAALLRKLHNEGHVAGEEYTATGEKIWNVTETGAGRVG